MKRPQWKEGLAWKRIGPYFIIVDEVNLQKIHRLNRTSSFIWEQLDGKHSVRNIASQLAEEYDVKIEEASRDTEQLILEFVKKGLLCE